MITSDVTELQNNFTKSANMNTDRRILQSMREGEFYQMNNNQITHTQCNIITNKEIYETNK